MNKPHAVLPHFHRALADRFFANLRIAVPLRCVRHLACLACTIAYHVRHRLRGARVGAVRMAVWNVYTITLRRAHGRSFGVRGFRRPRARQTMRVHNARCTAGGYCCASFARCV